KSKFNPGPAPKSATRIYEINGDTIRYTQNGVDADGKQAQIQFTAKYDGKDYPITGVPGTDTISLKRIDAYTFESTQKKGSKVVNTGRNRISEDGKVVTYTAQGTNAKGEKISSVQVFDKNHLIN